MTGLTFAELRSANVARCVTSFHPVGDWSIDDWGCALLGEIGETANLIKKRKRGDHVELRAVADELADVVIYLDLLAASAEVVIESNFYFAKNGIAGFEALFKDVEFAVTLCGEKRELSTITLAMAERAFFLVADLRSRVFDSEGTLASALRAVVSLAFALDIDLERAVIRKFNEVSDRVGSEIRLGRPALPVLFGDCHGRRAGR